jgi:hypothetical protein
LDDLEVVISHLKGSAKRLYNLASQVPNCRPISGKVINPNREIVRQQVHEPEVHFYETFNLGMCVPNGKLDLIDSNILLGKKLLFGKILNDNQDIQKLDSELLTADPQNNVNSSQKINVISTFNKRQRLRLYSMKTRFIRYF